MKLWWNHYVRRVLSISLFVSMFVFLSLSLSRSLCLCLPVFVSASLSLLESSCLSVCLWQSFCLHRLDVSASLCLCMSVPQSLSVLSSLQSVLLNLDLFQSVCLCVSAALRGLSLGEFRSGSAWSARSFVLASWGGPEGRGCEEGEGMCDVILCLRCRTHHRLVSN